MSNLPRGRLFSFLYLLLIANALPPFFSEAVQALGWLGAGLNLFNVSAIVWLASAAALVLAWNEPQETALHRGDGLVAALAIAAALLPVAAASGAMLTLAAIWAWSTSGPGSGHRRAAAIALTLSTFLIWGRAALAAGAGFFLAADAKFVSLISGMPVDGNRVEFANGQSFLIAPGCSSLHGISLALILWTTAVLWFNLAPSRRVRWALVWAIAASIMVNAMRLTAIAWNPQDFDYWHLGWGSTLFGGIAFAAIVVVIYHAIAVELR